MWRPQRGRPIPRLKALPTMSFPVPERVLRNAVALASDIDDTLTVHGRIPGENLVYISKLRQAGIKVFFVTGRTAGHGFSMTTYLDIDGAIAENGGVICVGETKQVVPDFAPGTLDRIKRVFSKVREEFPKARPTEDNFMRLTDRTFHVNDFSQTDIARTSDIAGEHGLGVAYSSVHLHICDPRINKGKTLKSHLESLRIKDIERVITIGDSPNDESIFDTSLFPNSVGVKNVEKYMERLKKKPRYILPEQEGHGFALLAKALLEAKIA